MHSHELIESNTPIHTHTFRETYKNVKCIELIQYHLPRCANVVEGSNSLRFVYNGGDYEVTIDEGVYTVTELVSAINTAVSQLLSVVGQVVLQLDENTKYAEYRAYSATEFTLGPDQPLLRMLGFTREGILTSQSAPEYQRIVPDQRVVSHPYVTATISLGDLPSKLPSFVLPISGDPTYKFYIDEVNPIELNPIGDLSELSVKILTGDRVAATMNQPYMLLLRITHELV